MKILIKDYILKVYFEYPKRFHNLHSDFPFLKEKMKLVCNYARVKTSIKSWSSI